MLNTVVLQLAKNEEIDKRCYIFGALKKYNTCAIVWQIGPSAILESRKCGYLTFLQQRFNDFPPFSG